MGGADAPERSLGHHRVVTVGDRSIIAEAYVLPAPPANRADVYRLCLLRNHRLWRCHFALDREGAVVLTGRLAASEVNAESLDLLLGEIYEAVELSFRPLAMMAFSDPRKERAGMLEMSPSTLSLCRWSGGRPSVT